jgi:UDP-N-acetylmuramoyl-L-alanyl-D-glutamate--2,6-diaminopimelate ligase
MTAFAMKLRSLLTVDAVSDARYANLEVRGISADSRTVKPGDLFVGLSGAKDDGLRYVAPAIARGAIAVIAERVPPQPLPQGVPFIRVVCARHSLALAASRFFRMQPQTVAAVTGTSGKTSVASFLRQIWTATGEQAASIGTIGLVSPRREVYGSLTTPDPIELHRSLAALAEEGVTHLAIEASSHGLDQHRLDGVHIVAAGFTNLSRDHLDYHASIEEYFAAKLRLFSDLVQPRGAAVICVDHPYAEAVMNAARQKRLRLLSVGLRGEGIKLVESDIDGLGQRLELVHTGNKYTVRLPLVGAFQVENALVAAGLAIATESEPKAVFASLENLKGAKGRLDLAGEKNGAPIYVDYAHKPDALAKALEALRPYVSRRLVLVFGCGGDRDPGKRPVMGAIAVEKADHVIVTDDNPRGEEPAKIRAAILAAARGATEIGDRREAIRAAIDGLRRGDVLLIAGKGHETGQIIGKQTLPFSDHDAVAAALDGRAA